MKARALFIMATLLVLAVCGGGYAHAEIARASGGPAADIPVVRVHFATGSADIVSEEQDALAANSAWMQGRPEAVIVLEGHCDERGGDLFNMELGDRRARAVKAELIRLGLNADRMIMVVSHGDRSPEDPAHTENAWKRNRRVEFVLR